MEDESNTIEQINTIKSSSKSNSLTIDDVEDEELKEESSIQEDSAEKNQSKDESEESSDDNGLWSRISPVKKGKINRKNTNMSKKTY